MSENVINVFVLLASPMRKTEIWNLTGDRLLIQDHQYYHLEIAQYEKMGGY
jgi:hypothetical protein